LLTALGIGEAIVSVLNEKGIPTPLAHTLMRAPESRMDVLTPSEIDAIIERSAIARKYNQEVDRESAYEILNQKIAEAQENQPEPQQKGGSTVRKEKEEPGMLETLAKDPLARQIGRTVARELTLRTAGCARTGRRFKKSSSKSWF
jgi:hypothetical protein